MPNTPVYALPYPTLSDTADVPRDIQALATKLDGLSGLAPGPPLVSALPGSPVDGQEVYYQSTAMATNGIVWQLRYRAASASIYKWEYVGGTPLYHDIPTNEAFNNVATPVDPATPGPTVTPALAGDYDASMGCNFFAAAASNVQIHLIRMSDTTAVLRIDASVAGPSAAFTFARNGKITVATAAIEYRMRYVGNGNTRDRWLRMIPIRVG